MPERREADPPSPIRFLLDSDWIIDALGNRPTAMDAIKRHRTDGIAVGIVALGELYDGAVRDQDPPERLAAIRDYVTSFRVLGLSDEIMEVFARHRVRLRQAGQRLPDLDLLIAATSLVHDLTLMTRNRRHYDRISGLRLYDDES